MSRKNVKLLIITIYVIHLSIYIFLYPKLINNIESMNNFYSTFKQPQFVIQYNPIYIHLYYFILSTYFMLNALNLHIDKFLKFVICGVAIILAGIAYYKYDINIAFADILSLTTSFLFLNWAIYRKLIKKLNLTH